MTFDVMMLPGLNATLNGVATVLLLTGFILIRRKRVKAHRAVMVTAFGISTLFLISYVTYHTMRGGMVTPFGGGGLIRVAYSAMLISHIVLAGILPVLAIVTIRRGMKGRYDRHRSIARWTLPVWLYVSVTGVVIYFMLYQWFPLRG